MLRAKGYADAVLGVPACLDAGSGLGELDARQENGSKAVVAWRERAFFASDPTAGQPPLSAV
ncbi:hypothetical protein [Chitiniphilus eburneus]|uniref:Uncharacterized protein n=1 Tax=Chitiniphilus eburneus TaxID=2571148 RepID=A0A4V5MS62_9NEIS|nr:hypothetical protein [Chitiniphilus eburneus]TJZ79028.1 hypothetical protein FAZ21_01715 [Chitiniphilus eburneus]